MLSQQNRQAGVEFGNSYIKINRAKAMQLEREKGKAEMGGGPLDTTCLAVEDKAETIRGAGHLCGSWRANEERELENLTMPGGRRVTAEEGQKRSFAKKGGKRKRVNPTGKGEILLKVSFLILALTLFNGFYL